MSQPSIQGLDGLYGPKLPGQQELNDRLESFRDWPSGEVVRPHDLAVAGFFYLGQGDHVMCFHCGGGLRSWVAGDKPLDEHKRAFPSCSFIRATLIM